MERDIATTIRSTLNRFPAVKLGYLFGSQARGDTSPLSDVDVAVYLDEPDAQKRFETRLTLIGALTSTLHRNDVDVVILNDLDSPEFAYFIITEGKLLKEEEPYRLQIEPYIVNAFFDFRTLLKQYGLSKAY